MFDNSCMRQPVRGKPHVVLINGFWRVSPLRTHNATYEQKKRWFDTHSAVFKENYKRAWQSK